VNYNSDLLQRKSDKKMDFFCAPFFTVNQILLMHDYSGILETIIIIKADRLNPQNNYNEYKKTFKKTTVQDNEDHLINPWHGYHVGMLGVAFCFP